MIKLNIKFFLTLGLISTIPIFCFGEDWASVIDSQSFVKFEDDYKNSNLSDDRKIEILRLNDKVIEDSLMVLKPFLGRIPNLEDIKRLKVSRYMYLTLSVCIFGLNWFPANMMLKSIRRQKKSADNPITAAQIGSPVGFQLYEGILEQWSSHNNSNYFKAACTLAICCGTSIGFACVSNYYKNILMIYKRYKKALKIQTLIQSSLQNV